MKTLRKRLGLKSLEHGAGDGTWLECAGEVVESRSPNDGSTVGRIRCAGRSEYDRIVRRAVEVAGGNPFLVMGGFHLREDGIEWLEEVAAVFDEAGVRFCGASHCTGDGQMAFFRDKYGDRYVPLGAGAVVRGADLAGE